MLAPRALCKRLIILLPIITRAIDDDDGMIGLTGSRQRAGNALCLNRPRILPNSRCIDERYRHPAYIMM